MRTLVLLLSGGMALAQTAPSSYTITEQHSFAGPPGESLVIYRSGSKAVIEINGRTRSVKDLDSHAQYDWSIADPAGGCSVGKWGGDWGDPFAESKEFQGELTKAGGKAVGNEAVNGIAAQVSEAAMPDGSKARMWVDPKLGLILRMQMTDKAGKTMTMIEVKSVSLVKPSDATFQIPPSCTATPKVDPDFAVATTPPASQEACIVMVRVVKAGTMEPIKTGFHMGIDLSVNQLHPQDHTVGMSPDGKPIFGGGGIRDMTGQFKDGVLRLGRIAGMFDIETAWDNDAGFASGMMYRQCFGPTTMLLMVVKDPTTLGKGVDWLWDKKGKYIQ